MIKKGFFILLSMMLVIAILIGCTRTDSKQTSSAPAKNTSGDSKTVKIGIIGARTGASATLGQYLDGAIAAFNKINDAGGINGYKFEVIVRDDEANPTKAKELVKDLLYKEGVSAIIGPTNTSNALAMLPEVFKAKVPLIDPVATGSKIGEEAKKLAKGDKNYFFRTTTPDYTQADAIAGYLKAKGIQKPVILHDETAYGKGGLKEIQAALDKAGVKPVKEVGFPMSTSDLTPQVMEAKQAQADALVVWALGHDQAQIAKAKQKLGFTVPMVGSTAMQQTNFRELAGDAANGNISIWPSNHVRAQKEGKLSQRITDAYEVYKKYFPKGYSLEDAGSLMFAYDAAMIVASAVEKAGNDPAGIRDAMESLPHKNIASKDLLQYSADNHEAWESKDIGMVKIEDNKIYQLNE
ncbi:ABC transporter substrate-binding protein [Aneurinibacillus tyrosinisolvens]|uniref:ABC transporter substrate-binding protein n=1 Tax=Aneurinibacillus tyrosinisolvens TaxID=1443435 RepID=UPI00063F3213|nr:ABC transporter substrate-binding protein [Aneurinibacillus tyrosinisolvens]